MSQITNHFSYKMDEFVLLHLMDSKFFYPCKPFMDANRHPFILESLPIQPFKLVMSELD